MAVNLPEVHAGDPYPQAVREVLEAHLGDRLVAAWLAGSVALGDFDARRSDVDIQAVARERLPEDDRVRLARALSHDALAVPARGLEFVLYARDDLRDAAGPAFQLNLNTGARMAQHVALSPADDPRFWFVVDVAIARQRALPLAGAPAADVLPELSPGLVAASLLEALDWYDEHGGSPVQTLLSACRTWAWATDGRWRSKGDSARWAAARLDDPGPVLRALELRDGAAGAPPSDGEVAELLGRARRALRALPG
jgi:aminoglycoside adenylyltransferase-like protein